jgi:hypothetical protein
MTALSIKKRRIIYFKFLSTKGFVTGRVLETIESLISMTVPRGQTKPQKNRPKIRVMNTMTSAKRILVIIVRKATLTISRTSGSKRKNIFCSFVGALNLVCKKNHIKSPRKKS